MTAALTSPVVLVSLTLGVYLLSVRLSDRLGRHPAANPVLVSIVVIASALKAADIDYADYAGGTQIISFWLGPATVALGWPLYRERARLAAAWPAIAASVTIGSGAAVLSAYGITRLAGGSKELALTMAPKSATTPVSVVLSEAFGGLAPLTAVLTILAGILGAVAGHRALLMLRVNDERAVGLAVGAASHGIGTARLLEVSPRSGAFSGLAMGLTALATSAWMPILGGIIS